MSVVLISLQRDTETIGLKYIHYALLGAGYTSTLLYLPSFDVKKTNRSVVENIIDFIKSKNPVILGISLMSIEYYLVTELTLILKNNFPQIKIIWGGVHPTIAPEDCIDHADFACIGEGEGVIVEIARRLSNGDKDIGSVPSLCYRGIDRLVKRNPIYPLNHDMDSLTHFEHIPKNAFILYHGEVRQLTSKIFIRTARFHGRTYSLMASRGCPYACSYCCNNVFNKINNTSKIRRRSAENIVNDIEKSLKDNPFISTINFQDDCFLSMNAKEISTFADLYKKRVNIPFVARSIPVYLNAEKLDVLKNAGLTIVIMGLQSGSDRVLRDIYNRRSHNKHIHRAVELCHERKIAVWLDVILDNPFELDEDIMQTIELLMSLGKPYYLQLFSLHFYEGTDLYEKVMNESPQFFESAKGRNYVKFKDTPLNRLASITPHISRRMTMRLLSLYRTAPKGWMFRVSLLIAQLLAFVLRPVTYARFFIRFHGNSLPRVLNQLYIYFLSFLHHRYVTRK